MRSKFFVLLCISFFGGRAFAQYPTTWSTYVELGRYASERAYQVVNAPDGGFYFSSGDSTDYPNGILRKTDSLGNILWTRITPTLAGPLLVDGSGVVAIGQYNSFAAGWLTATKYDPSGNLLWEKRYEKCMDGGFQNASFDPFGNIIFTGNIQASYTNDFMDKVIMKIDSSSGTVLWDKHFGPPVEYEEVIDALPDSAGNVYAWIMNVGSLVAHLARYSSTGTLIFSEQLAMTPLGFNCDASGNTYVIADNGANSTVAVTKFDSNGLGQWTKPLVGTANPNIDCCSAFDSAGNLVVVYQDTTPKVDVVSVSPTGTVRGIGHSPNGYVLKNERYSAFEQGPITFDSQGNLYVVAFATPSGNGSTPALIKFSPTTGYVWTQTSIGTGASSGEGDSVIQDASGRIVLLSTVNNVVTGLDARLTAFDTNGNQLWSQDYDTQRTGDSVQNAATDAVGNSYVLSYGVPTILTKFDPSGKVSWSKTIASYYASVYAGLRPPQIKSNGNVVIGLEQDASPGGPSGLIQEFDPNGNRVWAYNVPGLGVADCKIGNDGSTYVLIDGVTSGRVSVRLTKLNASGLPIWTVDKPNGPNREQPFLMVVDPSNSVYVGSCDPSIESIPPTLTKYNSAGTMQWSTALSNAGRWTGDLRLDSAGQPSIFILDGVGMSVVKTDVNGNILWSTPVLAGCQVLNLQPVAEDSSGRFFVSQWAQTGTTSYAIRVQRLSSTGTIDWTVDYPLTGNAEFPRSLIPDENGGVYVLTPDLTSDMRYLVFKVSANGGMPWPSSGGAFYNHAISYDPGLVDHLPAAMGKDAKGNLYVAGYDVGPSGTVDPHVIKYWANHSNFISQTVPTSMVAGQTYYITQTFQNDGFNTWTKAAGYKLVILNNATWGVSDQFFVSTDAIGPGANKTFTFPVYAPTTPGIYNFQTKLYLHSVPFAGTTSTLAPVNVVLKADAARFVTQALPSSATAGSKFTVTVDMRNVGTNTWTPAGGYALTPTSGNANWSVSTVPLSAGDSIAPGQDKVFTFTCTAPSAAGPFSMQWKMAKQGVQFGDRTTYKSVVATP